jgi:hypothetical protein
MVTLLDSNLSTQSLGLVVGDEWIDELIEISS